MSVQQVHLRINDAATGQPTPVRLRITDADGTYYAPFGRLTEFATGVNQDVGGNVMIGAKKWAYIDGTCEILLPPGTLHIEVTKGPEYTPIDQPITLLAGKLALRFTIERWSDLRKEGWYSGDTRVHFLSPDAALLEGQAEDVAVVNLLAVDTGVEECLETLAQIEPKYGTWARLQWLVENATNDKLSDDQKLELRLLVTAGRLLAMERASKGTRARTIQNIVSFSGQSFVRHTDQCGVAVNTQNNHHELGSLGLLHCHRIVYPLTFGGPDGTDDWTLEDWCDQCHRKNGLVVWTQPYLALSSELQFGERLADLVLGKIDAFEVTPSLNSSYPDMAEYFSLCDAELVVPLVGASGKKSSQIGLGEIRTFAHLPPEQPLTYTAWIEAVRAGRTFITSGPLLHWMINGAVPGHSLDLSGGNGTLRIRAEANSLILLERLELLLNGKVIVDALPLAAHPNQIVLEHELVPEESGWLALRCKGKRVFAHTSAVAIRPAGAPGWAAPAAVQRLLDELDKMVRWAKEKARRDTSAQRDRLTHVFETARTVLAKKLSTR